MYKQKSWEIKPNHWISLNNTRKVSLEEENPIKKKNELSKVSILQTEKLSQYVHASNDEWIGKKWLARMCNCQMYKEFIHQHTNKQRDIVKLLNTYACGSRFCIWCNSLRNTYRIEKTQLKMEKEIARNEYRVLHIVGTIKHTREDESKEVFSRLEKARNKLFEKVRDYRKWKSNKFFASLCANGGIWTIECTKTPKGYNWHINFIVLIAKDQEIKLYKSGVNNKTWKDVFACKEVSENWKEITGDSFVVSVQEVKDIKGGLKEVIKYSLKTEKEDNGRTLATYIKTTRGKRLFWSFGCVRGNDAEEQIKKLIEKANKNELEEGERIEWEKVVVSLFSHSKKDYMYYERKKKELPIEKTKSFVYDVKEKILKEMGKT